MRNLARVTLVLALMATAVCLVTGIVYIGASADAGMDALGPWLATLGSIGASAMGAAGVWQILGVGVPRLIALLVLSALSAGYVMANVLALVQDSAAGFAQAPPALHAVGAVVGGALYLVALLEASLAFRARPAEPRARARAPGR